MAEKILVPKRLVNSMPDDLWEVEVDAATCIGSAMCVSLAPSHFQLDGGQSKPTSDTFVGEDVLLDAGNACPIEAIRVRNQRTGEVLVPEPGPEKLGGPKTEAGRRTSRS